MRIALAASVLLAACGGSREPKHVYITVGNDARASVEALAAADGNPARAFDDVGDASVLEVDEHELDDISHLMHEQFGRCGGFMAHDSLDDARMALVAQVWPPKIDYTIDHQPVVQAVLPTLDKNA